MNEVIEKLRAAAVGGNGKPDITPQATLAVMLREIEAHILKYVELERPELATLLALWITQSYRTDAFAFCGFLSLHSASPRCGKSRLLEILGCITEELTPLRTMPSLAVLYRTSSQVIFLDEVDNLRNGDKEKYGEIMALLNVAFKRGGIVERCNKQTLKVERFPAYRAFGFAGVNSLSDALADRCFPIRMKRTTRKMPRLNLAKLETETFSIRTNLTRWWERNAEDVIKTYEGLEDETAQLKGRDDRLQDISEPLLVLAMCADAEAEAGQSITTQFLEAIEAISGRREVSLDEDNLNVFLVLAEGQLKLQTEAFVPSHDLVDLCRDTEGLEWIDTTRRLRGFLKKFDLFPKNQSGKVRGYVLTQEWVDEWGARYA